MSGGRRHELKTYGSMDVKKEYESDVVVDFSDSDSDSRKKKGKERVGDEMAMCGEEEEKAGDVS